MCIGADGQFLIPSECGSIQVYLLLLYLISIEFGVAMRNCGAVSILCRQAHRHYNCQAAMDHFALLSAWNDYRFVW